MALARLGTQALGALDALAAGIGRVGRSHGGLLTGWARRHFGEDGAFSRSWPIGTTALWMALLLSGYVLIHYL